MPQPHASPAPRLPGHAEGPHKKAPSPTCPLCQHVVKTSSRLISTVTPQPGRGRWRRLEAAEAPGLPAALREASVPRRAKLLKDKSGAGWTDIIDKEAMAVPRRSALTFPDLRQAPPHITTFHLPHPASERYCPRFPVVERRLRETQKPAHMSMSGTEQRLWRALGQSADIKTVYPYSPVTQTSSIYGGDNLEHQGRRDKNSYTTRTSFPWTNRACVSWESVGPRSSYENSFTH